MTSYIGVTYQADQLQRNMTLYWQLVGGYFGRMLAALPLTF